MILYTHEMMEACYQRGMLSASKEGKTLSHSVGWKVESGIV
ncbi:hypothetical protein PROSTU_01842 [Providencia stuartii ATCC 25827]|uniref:Uncharacterized protein n=1 Tax=Providencia stuartii ATCC 25827 TaxID=471874 RepID=A0AA87CSI5_PROST|nr:hypothetical protein PROSTU_01842 [Providencia stuartii ATCC 25827]